MFEVISFREQQLAKFKEAEKELEKQKAQLWKKDISEWQYEGEGGMIELIARKHELKAHKKLAFPYILTKESQVLQ